MDDELDFHNMTYITIRVPLDRLVWPSSGLSNLSRNPTVIDTFFVFCNYFKANLTLRHWITTEIGNTSCLLFHQINPNSMSLAAVTRRGFQLCYVPSSSSTKIAAFRQSMRTISTNNGTSIVQVDLEDETGVGILTMNQPPANTLSLEM